MSTSHMIYSLVALLVLLGVCSCQSDGIQIPGDRSADYDKRIVAIQPYEDFDSKLIETIKSSIVENYGFDVQVYTSQPMPKSAFVRIKSPRYRADSLILLLKRAKPDSIDYILGLTGRDISFTKKDKNRKPLEPQSRYQDWGIFGLGYVPGPSCIVSSYRLGSAGALLRSRIVKVSLHELGHNLGLPHCSRSDSCVMRDAAESIRTVDGVSTQLCEHCRSSI